MEFHLITGFGSSAMSFHNNEDPTQIGQGMLQGSSSAAPIYNISNDVSLSTYGKIATGSTFIHPINRQPIHDHATQYVDDKTEMLNLEGANINPNKPTKVTDEEREQLFHIANLNSDKWIRILWISGGNLNVEKCFYYYLQPSFNFATQKITYKPTRQSLGHIKINNPATQTTIEIKRLEPKEARRTLGVMVAPDGNASKQYQVTKEKATTYLNRIK
jgi:hypothetical protein